MIDRTRYSKGKFLKADDVKNGGKFTIESFEEIEFTQDGEKQLRPCLRLVGVEPPFALNMGNLDFMIDKYGENEQKWIGKKITLNHVRRNDPKGNKVTSLDVA